MRQSCILFITLLVLLASSCKKDSSSPSTPTDTGITYTGRLLTGNTITFHYNFSPTDVCVWDLGEMGPEAHPYIKMPTYTYNKPGTYNIVLNINNGKQAPVKTTITIAPNVNFSYTGDPCPNESLTFISSMTGQQYLWNFGDGTTSTESTPHHAYTSTGTYQVNLTLDTFTTTKAVSILTDPLYTHLLAGSRVLQHTNKKVYGSGDIIVSTSTETLTINVINAITLETLGTQLTYQSSQSSDSVLVYTYSFGNGYSLPKYESYRLQYNHLSNKIYYEIDTTHENSYTTEDIYTTP